MGSEMCIRDRCQGYQEQHGGDEAGTHCGSEKDRVCQRDGRCMPDSGQREAGRRSTAAEVNRSSRRGDIVLPRLLYCTVHTVIILQLVPCLNSMVVYNFVSTVMMSRCLNSVCHQITLSRFSSYLCDILYCSERVMFAFAF